MNTLALSFYIEHKKNSRGLRLGQHFCNLYIKSSWPSLYYEQNDKEALRMIDRWLIDHHYFDTLPLEHNSLRL